MVNLFICQKLKSPLTVSFKYIIFYVAINMNFDEAIKISKKARENAYAPYSNYFVGAALKTKSR